MIEFTECYYFDHIYTHADGRDWDVAPVASSQTGFVVSKYDGYARTVTRIDLILLKEEERRMDELYELALNVKEKKAGLDIIKSRYGLNTKQLLIFLKVIQKETFDRLTVTAKLEEIIKNIRQHKYPGESY
ncbi:MULTISPECIES: hypothetical protein [Niastella]|uniref:ANTAR domain-containing protein n=1 Tax=Niastella soli TaxID=2821487 RepID=A0ABS3Z2J1_9BACT|nr:hypothetical protein [Niastella soli]MBO9203621.1 hypothetical protein [Niastella soli]